MAGITLISYIRMKAVARARSKDQPSVDRKTLPSGGPTSGIGSTPELSRSAGHVVGTQAARSDADLCAAGLGHRSLPGIRSRLAECA